jgi:hypothetical protein
MMRPGDKTVLEGYVREYSIHLILKELADMAIDLAGEEVARANDAEATELLRCARRMAGILNQPENLTLQLSPCFLNSDSDRV